MNGGFRERSIFEGGQRGTPHPLPLDIFPRSWDNFNICDNITVARKTARPDLWQIDTIRPIGAYIAIGIFANLAIGGTEPQRGERFPSISSKKIR